MSKPTRATPQNSTDLPADTSAVTPALPPESNPPPADTSTYLPFEAHAAVAGTPAYLLAATRVHAAWLPGQEMSREQYDVAVNETEGSVMK